MASHDFYRIENKIDRSTNIGNKLISDFDFTDVTLVCAENQHIPAHRAVLCANSSFLRELLYDSQQQRTFLYLGRVHHEDFRTLMEFMYLGTCSVRKDSLADVMALAAELEISEFLVDIKMHPDLNNETLSLIDAYPIKESLITPEIQNLQLQVNIQNSKLTKSFEELNNDVKMEKQVSMLPLDTSFTDISNFCRLESVLSVSESDNNFETLGCLGKQNDIQMSLIDQKVEVTERKLISKHNGKQKLIFLPKTEIPEPDNDGMYNCNTCEFRSVDKCRYIKHKVIKHEGFSYNCETCSDKFPSLPRLKQHIRSLHEGVWYECTECNKQFSEKSSLDKHKEGKKQCQSCDYISCARKVNKHSITIHNTYFQNGSYKCDQCGYQTTKNDKLSNHRQKVHDNILFPCTYCDFQNKEKSYLKVHIEEKHLRITHQCDIC